MIARLAALFAVALTPACAQAHDDTGHASAIANEGVMVEAGGHKLLFDPLFEIGIHPDMDESHAAKIVAGLAPYDEVDAVFVSHFHRDHFSAPHLNAMLAAQPGLRLHIPHQALDPLRADAGWSEAFAARIEPIFLDIGETRRLSLGTTEIEVIRVPHTGWPERHAGVENLVFRVALAPGQRVMHLGDADADDRHFAPHADFFAARRSGIAFVPWWFLVDPDARAIVDTRLNAEKAIGIHVGGAVNPALRDSGADYFSQTGETREIPHMHGE